MKYIYIKPIFILFLTTIQISSYAQIKNNNKEINKFICFVIDSILKKEDTIFVKHYLNNKNMFVGTVLIGEGLTKSEIQLAIEKIHDDSSKYVLSKKIFNSVKLLQENDTSHWYWTFSLPIFLRSYCLCLFSYGTIESQKTILCKKENDKWSLINKIGQIANY